MDEALARRSFDLYEKSMLASLEQEFGTRLSVADREEVVAAVIGRFVAKPYLYRPGPRSLKGYLIFCAGREAQKRAGRNAKSFIEISRRAENSIGLSSPLESVIAGEDHENLRQSIKLLGAMDRAVVECWLENPESYWTILAAKTGESKSAIQTRKSRALDELRRLMEVDRSRSVAANGKNSGALSAPRGRA